MDWTLLNVGDYLILTFIFLVGVVVGMFVFK